jgi:ribose transport system permease protein
MILALRKDKPKSRALTLARKVNIAVIVLIALYLAIGIRQPIYLEPAGVMNFLRRAAPLAILASGQLFVLTSGGFDLSVGSLVTLTVIGGSMLTANDPANTWWTIGFLYTVGLAVGLLNGLIVAYLKVPSIIATLGMLLSVNGAAMLWSGGRPARLSAGEFPYVRTLRFARRADHWYFPARDRRARRRRRAGLLGTTLDGIRSMGIRGRRQSARR